MFTKIVKNFNKKSTVRNLSSYINSHVAFSKEISVNGVSENIYIKENFSKNLFLCSLPLNLSP